MSQTGERSQHGECTVCVCGTCKSCLSHCPGWYLDVSFVPLWIDNVNLSQMEALATVDSAVVGI